ncbi:thiol-disulfide isomerase/thioredoxin [Kribbella sp. VKM Ac-2527]|jgi:thiol-disulfide isomerase/thioredoxin|uniref:Thiol-disulfide isomerase/thioredoxin n=1 Tax=Kribbella caucasensis TaxID=2512215 RepID=A0A4R6K1T3_9ACTN|nr:TlpA disulfide reductase family protein [Kribbella sp. VKM Ac-2527]TDO43164.1 thiol-disulfide isomerase/thioredoxin [Kribbella sp. VKM Ac-2527]
MMRRTALAVAGLVLTLTACSSGQQTNENRSGQTGFVSGNGRVSTFAAADRKPAPAFGGETLDGKQWNFADHKGKVVVLNVWGSWCPPCRKEAPDLIAASKELGPDVQFIGLNTRDLDKAPAKKFVQEFGVTFPSLFDPSGKQLLGFRGQISPTSIPSTLVIDKDGKVASRVIGEVTTQTLVGMVKDAS